MAEGKRRKKTKSGGRGSSSRENAPPTAPEEESPPSPPGGEEDRAEVLRRLEELEEERDGFKERLQRVSAEFANYQKRVQREMEENRKHGMGPVLRDVLEILDDLQRALSAAEGKVEEDYLHGFRMIEERFNQVLAKHGVTPVEALGRSFDPHLHDALMEVEDSNHPDLTVVEEFQRGYRLHDRLLRPARVKVARNRPARAERSGDGAGTRTPVEEDDGG